MLHNPRKIIFFFNFLLPEMNFICRQNSENFWWFLVPCHFLYCFCIEMLRCMYGVLCAVHHVMCIVYSWKIVHLAKEHKYLYSCALSTQECTAKVHAVHSLYHLYYWEEKKWILHTEVGWEIMKKKSLILNLCIMTIIIIIIYYKSHM